MTDLWPWITLVGLGAYHGINPGMGWLFAVALGLQEGSRKAVVRAFLPIALGHAASIAAVVALVAALQSVVSPAVLRHAGAGALVAFGLYKWLAPMSHPRWVGMRVGFRDLTAWSFLMATAHGAGLMLVPVVLKLPSEPGPHAAPAARTAPARQAAAAGPAVFAGGAAEARLAADPAPAPGKGGLDCHHCVARMDGVVKSVAAVVLHTAAMFLVMALVAVVVYEKVGLAILRRAWFNLDLLWAGALIGAGVLTFFL